MAERDRPDPMKQLNREWLKLQKENAVLMRWWNFGFAMYRMRCTNKKNIWALNWTVSLKLFWTLWQQLGWLTDWLIDRLMAFAHVEKLRYIFHNLIAQAHSDWVYLSLKVK